MKKRSFISVDQAELAKAIASAEKEEARLKGQLKQVRVDLKEFRSLVEVPNEKA